MSSLTDVSSLLGGTNKALIVVTRETARATSSSSSSSGLASVSSAMSSVGLSLDTNTQEVFKVQYNPSSLSIAANAQDTCVKSMHQGADANALVQMVRPPSFVLTVNLIFDDTTNSDCFYSEMYSLSVTSVASTVASLVGTYSVRPEMEGFLATVLNNELREVSFIWGDMLFSGQVRCATATYTMFNTNGVPIRGNIEFQIQQSITGSQSSDYWTAAFTKIENGEFKKTLLDSVSGLINTGL